MSNETLQSEPDKSGPIIVVHEVVLLMASIMNYLSVSLYEGLFQQRHQEALSELNTIYNEISKNPQNAPSFKDAVLFYNNFVYLSKVMDTDDPDYSRFRKSLYRYINANIIKNAC
jgi:hypothetical protein